MPRPKLYKLLRFFKLVSKDPTLNIGTDCIEITDTEIDGGASKPNLRKTESVQRMGSTGEGHKLFSFPSTSDVVHLGLQLITVHFSSLLKTGHKLHTYHVQMF